LFVVDRRIVDDSEVIRIILNICPFKVYKFIDVGHILENQLNILVELGLRPARYKYLLLVDGSRLRPLQLFQLVILGLVQISLINVELPGDLIDQVLRLPHL
jgi:hypothetical protein